jgi:hypothetical protein
MAQALGLRPDTRMSSFPTSSRSLILLVTCSCSDLIACCRGGKDSILDVPTKQIFIHTGLPLVDHGDTKSQVGNAHVVDCMRSSLCTSFVAIGRILIPPLSINSSGSVQTEVTGSFLFATHG